MTLSDLLAVLMPLAETNPEGHVYLMDENGVPIQISSADKDKDRDLILFT